MGIKQFFKETAAELKRKKAAYILVIVLPILILGQALLPFIQWLSEKILAIHGIPYLAHSTLPMFLTHPTSIVLLLLLAVVILLAVFFMFCFTLIGIRMVRRDSFRFAALLKESWSTLLRYGLKSIPGLLFYFILLMPAIGLIAHSEVFSKISLPDFVTEVLYSNVFVACLFAAGYIVLFYVGLMRIYTLPLMILEKMNIADAFKKSEQLTKGKKKGIFVKLILISLISSVGASLSGFVFYNLQTLFDASASLNSLAFGVADLSLIKIFNLLFSLFSTSFLLFLIIPKEDLSEENKEAPSEAPAPEKRKKAGTAAVILFIAYLLYLVVSSIFEMTVPFTNDVKIISHRGRDTDQGNGVQNLISTMLKTYETSDPYYSELDIHETKDLQFIAFHDESLKNLCGVDGIPHDYTLEELQRFTAEENGFSGTLSNFDDYLKAADEAGQKLLIEIKPTSADSPDMMDRFIRQYGEDILEHGHIIHSMGYDAVRSLVGGFGADQTEPVESVQNFASATGKNHPFFTSAIVPYNLIFAGFGGEAISVEETFVDEHLIETAHNADLEVFVWTVNDENIMKRLLFLGVDGIITDRPTTAKAVLQSFSEDTPYAARIEMYLDAINTLQ